MKVNTLSFTWSLNKLKPTLGLSKLGTIAKTLLMCDNDICGLFEMNSLDLLLDDADTDLKWVRFVIRNVIFKILCMGGWIEIVIVNCKSLTSWNGDLLLVSPKEWGSNLIKLVQITCWQLVTRKMRCLIFRRARSSILWLTNIADHTNMILQHGPCPIEMEFGYV